MFDINLLNESLQPACTDALRTFSSQNKGKFRGPRITAFGISPKLIKK